MIHGHFEVQETLVFHLFMEEIGWSKIMAASVGRAGKHQFAAVPNIFFRTLNLFETLIQSVTFMAINLTGLIQVLPCLLGCWLVVQSFALLGIIFYFLAKFLSLFLDLNRQAFSSCISSQWTGPHMFVVYLFVEQGYHHLQKVKVTPVLRDLPELSIALRDKVLPFTHRDQW